MKSGIMFFVLMFMLINISAFIVNSDFSYCKTYQSPTLLDTTKPVITHYGRIFLQKYLWPCSLGSTITDNTGIDSAWVKWYKNSPSVLNRQFRTNPSGNYYSGTFNSVNSDVNDWDVIFYRIFAVDNSTNHNIDSSQLYYFTISNGPVCKIGTGTDSSKYPFTTYWMDGRTQMLFTSSELSACGIVWGSITKIGFKVISVAPLIMNGFNIRFQNTSQTSLTGFVTFGTWFTAYSGTYSVQDTGWQVINLPSPHFYHYNNNNLLVEICYDNSSYTEFSYVYATPAIGMTWAYYTDNTSGCTMTGGTAQSIRPNIVFEFNVTMGVNGNNINIPEKYMLHQNYPNPFNPVTKINYDIPKNGFVRLKVYDMLGREIRTLVNEDKQAGSYIVDFNASEFSTGVYFYKLISKEFTDVKRMVLLK